MQSMIYEQTITYICNPWPTCASCNLHLYAVRIRILVQVMIYHSLYENAGPVWCSVRVSDSGGAGRLCWLTLLTDLLRVPPGISCPQWPPCSVILKIKRDRANTSNTTTLIPWPQLIQCCASVADAGPALIQAGFNSPVCEVHQQDCQKPVP